MGGRPVCGVGMDIFELDDELRQVQAALENMESDDELEAVVRDYLGDLKEQRAKKLDGYADLIAYYESLSKAASDEARRLSELAQTRSNHAARLKSRLFTALEVAGIERDETPKHKFWIQANGGKLPLIVDGEVPVDYTKTTVTTSADNDKIREALEAGKAVPFARFGPRGRTLRIK